MSIGIDWLLSELTFDLGYSEHLLHRSIILELDSELLGAQGCEPEKGETKEPS